jgi:molecular chaperone HtpG
MNLSEFDDYTLQAITKEGLDLGGGKDAKKYYEEKEEEFEKLIEWLSEVYGSKVSKVAVSDRLEDSPMIFVTTKYGYSANMERIAKGQAFGSKSPTKATKVLEINCRHPLLIALKQKVEEDEESEDNKDLANLLVDAALLNSGFSIDEDAIATFSQRVDRIARSNLGVEADAEVEALPEFSEDDDEDDDDEEELRLQHQLLRQDSIGRFGPHAGRKWQLHLHRWKIQSSTRQHQPEGWQDLCYLRILHLLQLFASRQLGVDVCS